jgi:hypothetical protein
MFMQFSYVCALLVLVVGPVGSMAQSADPTKSNYLVFQSKKPEEPTDLQRIVRRTGKDSPDFEIIINASAAVRGDHSLDPKAIDLRGLEKELNAVSRLGEDRHKPRVSINMAYYRRQPDDQGGKMLRWTLMGLALDCDCEKIDVYSSHWDYSRCPAASPAGTTPRRSARASPLQMRHRAASAFCSTL